MADIIKKENQQSPLSKFVNDTSEDDRREIMENVIDNAADMQLEVVPDLMIEVSQGWLIDIKAALIDPENIELRSECLQHVESKLNVGDLD